MTRLTLIAAVEAAEHRLAVARALVAGWRAQGVPIDDGAVVRAEAAVVTARAALAQKDTET